MHADDANELLTDMTRISARDELVAAALLFATLALAIVLDEAGIQPASGPRLVLTLIAVLAVPGYFWQIALFPRRSSLESWERSALVVGLSASSIPPLAMVLDGLLHVSLHVETILAAVTIWTGFGILAAYARRRAVPADHRFHVRFAAARLSVRLRRDRTGALLIAGLALATGVWALALLLTYNAQGPGRSFTEFYVLGTESLAQNYPSALRVGSPTLLTTTVINRESHAAQYVVMARIADQVLGQSDPVTVAAGASADLTVTVLPLAKDTDVPLDLDLMRDGQTGVYRRLRLWVDVLPPSA